MFMSFSTVPHMFPISIVAHRFLDGTWWQIPTQQLQNIDPLWVLVVNFSEVTVCCPVFDPGMNIR
jgi:dipeptide/tripeptide permease